MKKFGIALALALGVASAPGYAVVPVAGVKNPTSVDFTTGSSTIDFNTLPVGSAATTVGFTGGKVENGEGYDSSIGATYSAPGNDIYKDPTNYYAVGPFVGTPAQLAISGISQFSLFWGSIDTANKITFLGLTSGVFSFTGDTFLDGSKDASISRVVTFYLTPDEAKALTGIEFSSTDKNAFEFDNVNFSSAVPEPSVWAMMMMGLGLVGAALRRRVSTVGCALGIA